MVEKVNPEKLWVNPDCGLKTRGIEEIKAGLKNLIEAAVTFRQKYNNL